MCACVFFSNDFCNVCVWGGGGGERERVWVSARVRMFVRECAGACTLCVLSCMSVQFRLSVSFVVLILSSLLILLCLLIVPSVVSLAEELVKTIQ